ncbi:hypothetical protein ACFL4H_00210 [Candidatus Neomarinimicrobiota bacterium]
MKNQWLVNIVIIIILAIMLLTDYTRGKMWDTQIEINQIFHEWMTK